MKFLVILALVVSAVAVPSPGRNQRIIGGSVVTIDHYPSIAPLLFGLGDVFTHYCGSTILNTRSILTASHCFIWDSWDINPNHYRIRVGSTFVNSGGTVHALSQIFQHPRFDWYTLYNDIAIIRLATVISFNTYTQPAAIAGTNYNLADNQAVWAAGWGAAEYHGQPSEHLRHVQVYVVNQAVCRARFNELGNTVTDDMLCSGVLDVGDRDQCLGDPGSPLYHNNVVVGVYSWGIECGMLRYPSVSTRVSSFTPWIQANA